MPPAEYLPAPQIVPAAVVAAPPQAYPGEHVHEEHDALPAPAYVPAVHTLAAGVDVVEPAGHA